MTLVKTRASLQVARVRGSLAVRCPLKHYGENPMKFQKKIIKRGPDNGVRPFADKKVSDG